MSRPLKGPSSADMWSDEHDPPTVRREAWERARNMLFTSNDEHLKGMAKNMNLAQENYLSLKSVVGIQGRLFAERFLDFKGLEAVRQDRNTNLQECISKLLQKFL